MKQQGSYRSGGIALINGVFEVCAKLIKCDDLKNKALVYFTVIMPGNAPNVKLMYIQCNVLFSCYYLDARVTTTGLMWPVV